MRGFIARHRRAAPVRWLARRSTKFLRAYHNVDYKAHRNGEDWLLGRLAADRPSCVFDVGANVGDWARAAWTALPDARIHCFEPVPDTAARLTDNLAGLDRITINRVGLSDHAGDLTLKIFPHNSTVATVTDFPRAEASRQVTVPVTTGDAYLAEAGIDRIDLLKIDAEGAEPQVLVGFADTLAQGRIAVIQFEYGLANILTKFLLRDFHLLLGGHGYRLGKLYPNHVAFADYALEDEDFLGPNYVAVRADRPDLIDRLS
ncbi:MAG: FkbM family methyltransferase [Inquilinaceae bacterium]